MLPETVMQKDINDMVLHGKMTTDEIVKLINTFTFSGIGAKLRFATWRRI
jgi:hypothetical protein